jgi:hypothetical protein
MIADDELGRMQKKVVMAFLILVYCIYFGVTEKDHEILRINGFFELKFLTGFEAS